MQKQGQFSNSGRGTNNEKTHDAGTRSEERVDAFFFFYAVFLAAQLVNQVWAARDSPQCKLSHDRHTKEYFLSQWQLDGQSLSQWHLDR